MAKYSQISFLWKTVIFIVFIIAVSLIFISVLVWYKNIDSNDRSSFPRYNETERIQIQSAKNCFQSKTNVSHLVLFDDILESSIKPEPDKSIFFHVTTCFNNQKIQLTARQACAMESAALWNPSKTVFLLFASPAGFATNETIAPIVNALKLYANIQFRHVNPITYSIGTPAHDWIKTNRIFVSSHFDIHLSEYLRFLTLYKFGGIHFDLDMIVLRNLDYLPANFVGAESNNRTNIGAIGFESRRLGHKIIEMVLREYMEIYETYGQTGKGAEALARVLMKICRRNHIADLLPNYCWGFNVLPPNAFNPISSEAWKRYFDSDPQIVYQTLDIVKASIAIHLWDRYSTQKVIDKFTEKTTYGILAEMNCPNVFRVSGSLF